MNETEIAAFAADRQINIDQLVPAADSQPHELHMNCACQPHMMQVTCQGGILDGMQVYKIVHKPFDDRPADFTKDPVPPGVWLQFRTKFSPEILYCEPG